MKRISFIPAALSLLAAASSVSCLGSMPTHVDPERVIPLPVMIDERIPTVSAPHTLEESRVAGVMLDEPPETCFGTDQPAIVRAQPDETGTRRPIWMCRVGCAPGFERVTVSWTSSRRHSQKEYAYFEPECTPLCAPNQHRVSYLVDATTTAAHTCGPGSPSASLLAARAREEARRLAAVVDVWRADLAEITRRVTLAEAAPRPWDDTTVATWAYADQRLRLLEHGLRAWFAQAPVVAPVGENYPGASEAEAKAAASSFLARAHDALPRDARRQVEAARDRVDHLAGEARRSRDRAAAREEALAKRADAEQAAAAVTRERVACTDTCQGARRACSERCQKLTASACDACALALAACLPQCDAAR